MIIIIRRSVHITLKIVKVLALRRKQFGLMLGVVIVLVGSISVSGLLNVQRTISSTGSIKSINVEVYWDSECTQVINEVDWGQVMPGEDIIKTVYVKNSGNSPMTLSLSYSAWSPVEAGNYLSLAWNREGSVVNAGSVRSAVLTLSVDYSIFGISDYSFNILIQGSG
jgi:hypothetical protein